MCDCLDISRLRSTAAHPETDGQTERVNGSMVTFLRCHIADTGKNWLDSLQAAEMVYNSSVHKATGYSPYYLNYGYDPILPHELPAFLSQGAEETPPDFVARLQRDLDQAKRTMQMAQDKMKEYADKKRRPAEEYKLNDLVLLLSDVIGYVPQGKLTPRWVGPYKIVECMPGGQYKLDLPQGWEMSPVFHQRVMSPWRGAPQPPPPASQQAADLRELPQQERLSSPCVGGEQPGVCKQTKLVMGVCGYCITCHREAMMIMGEPFRCRQHHDHVVDAQPPPLRSTNRIDEYGNALPLPRHEFGNEIDRQEPPATAVQPPPPQASISSSRWLRQRARDLVRQAMVMVSTPEKPEEFM